jgi:exoribonuclease R
VALCAGAPVPQWVLAAMPDLPATMQDAGHRASAYEHAITDLVEAELLKGSVGDRFTGVVLEADHDDPRKGKVQIAEPAIEATVRGADPLPVGEDVDVVLSLADPATRKVEFTR